MDTRGIRAELIPIGAGNPVEIFPGEVGSRVGGWGRVETVHLVWDGRLPNGSFTDSGEYVVKIRSLRLFGDERKEADWRDGVVSSKFRLEYEAQSIKDDNYDPTPFPATLHLESGVLILEKNFVRLLGRYHILFIQGHQHRQQELQKSNA
ncbi:subtilisin-like serine protease pr1c [Colletotrichum musicola]|uniref:Subtilisin-like serine protease pr1c n=1 Tax=Colletotrichum musicola TaxID=2175873 RepID=A0A8H6MKN7_9PEZI|nr:subtilisin-like serine protease pr1c [Colletotrichum musicola]